MKRLLAIIALSMVLLPSVGAARTIADFLASEPGNVFPLLTRTNRLDLVDYYNSGQTVAVPNNLGGTSQFIELDSVYLKLQTSESRVVEMRMLTTGTRDTVIVVIETVMTPVPDSRLTLWNSKWQMLRTDRHFKMPGIDDFLVKKMPRELRADLQDAMIFPLIQLSFKGDNHNLVEAIHGLEQFLAPNEFKRFAPYLKPSITYRMSGTKIKPVK